MNVLEICPYEPPASGWVNRVKLLRRVIEERGGRCEILDIGPSRTVERTGCICVYGAGDYVKKVWRFTGQGFVIHNHVNGRYFRGILLSIAGQLIGRLRGSRCLTTFHAGLDQPFILGWRRAAIWPFYRTLFGLSHAVVCNSAPVADNISIYARRSKIHPIPAFSAQYMEFEEVQQEATMQQFMSQHRPLISTYICYRPGFYIETLTQAIAELGERMPEFGIVVVGTGDGQDEFERDLKAKGCERHVHIAGNLNHDEFLSLIARSDVHLRTPTSDGVSSTVLESLALRVPVLAAENGTRPESVILYEADKHMDLVQKFLDLWGNHAAAVKSIPDDIVSDTAAVEVDLLVGS